MSLNNLLIWMSARGQGSWQRFRSGVEEFHVEPVDSEQDGETGDDATVGDLPLYQAVRLGLERLAHVEFVSSGTERRWRVVPPALAVSQQGAEWVGILCGARSPSLGDELRRLPDTLSWDVREMPGMPDRMRLTAPNPEELYRAGERLGLLTQRDAPASLLAAIPPMDDPRSRYAADAPSVPGWTIQRFSPSTLRWEGADYTHVCEAKTGLFRFRMQYQRFHFLRWRGRTFRVPVQVGKYAVLRRSRVRRLVWYDRERAVLSVPVTCRPPLLIERALVLCSGLLARLDPAAGRLVYSQVPPSIAQIAAALLRQEIENR